MAIVDDADVQIHLPVDKLKIEEIPDDLVKAKDDAERIVRGYLAGVIDSTILAGWTSPALTPPEVRAIAGRLTAALIYRTRYSEQSLDDPQFAQTKYTEAMKMLNDILSGNFIVTGVVDTTQFDSSYFEPNDASEDPKFTMSGRF
jgi:hypothetical protein